MVLFFLSAVFDEESYASGIILTHNSNARNTKFFQDGSFQTHLPPIFPSINASRDWYFKKSFLPNKTYPFKACKHNFSYSAHLKPLLLFIDSGKFRGVHSIHAPPDQSPKENSGYQPFKSKTTFQSLPQPCIQIPDNLTASTLPISFAKNPASIPAGGNRKRVSYPATAIHFPHQTGSGEEYTVYSQQEPQLVCPEDISTYTDINACTSFIGGNLDPVFNEEDVATLTWEMTGATEDASPEQGINLAGEYTFNEGTTLVTYTATNVEGATTTCSFNVIISDNQVPRITNLPDDITVNTEPGQCGAVVFWNNPSAVDNCTPSNQIIWESTSEPGNLFPLGQTRVHYRAYDAMGNESSGQSFVVTVEDNEPPEFTLPGNETVDCGHNIPAPWNTLRELLTAGGVAIDNCGIAPASFRLTDERQDAENCPYTLIRTYQIADAAGNTATAQHRIVVQGEEPETTEEDVRLKGATAETITAIDNGNWNDVNTWNTGTIPASDDDVVIPDGFTVTVDAVAECNDILIQAGGTLDHNGTTTLQVYGNWTNNGSYAGGSGSVEFTGSNPATIGGSASTVFKHFTLSKGAIENILQVNGNTELSGDITFSSGLMQINTGTIVTCTHNTGFTIENAAGLSISGGTFSSGAFSITNNGLFKVISGTANIGQFDGNSLQTATGGTFQMEGGTLNVSGRLYNSAGEAIITGGTINISTVGHSNSTYASFHISANTNLTIENNPEIILHIPNSGSMGDIVIIDGGTGIKNITGGTFIVGSSSTPAGSTFHTDTSFPLHNLHINSHNNPGMRISGNDLIINNQLTMQGGNIDATSQIVSIANESTSSLSHSAGHITGNLQRAVAGSGDRTYSFPVGNNGNNTPLELIFSGLSSNGFVTVSSTGDEHPNIGASLLNSNQSVNNYWTVNNSGVSFSSVDGTFEFPSGLTDGGDYLVGLYNGSSWSYPNTISASTTSANFGGLGSLPGTATFALAECETPTITLGTNPVVCEGTTFATLPYSSVSNSPDQYRIDYDTDAESAGFTDVPWAALPASPVTLSIPDNLAPATYNGTLYVKNELDCSSADYSFSVTIDPLPTAFAGGSTSICEDESYTLSSGEATASNGTIQWSHDGAGALSNATTRTPTYTPAAGDAGNTVILTMTVTGENACGPETATATYSIIVNPIPTLTSASQDAAVCDGSPAAINLTGLLPGTTFSLDYTINGVAQTTATGLTADASGNSSFSTGNLTTAHNGQTLRITAITVTSATPHCSCTFSEEITLQVNSLPSINCPSPISLGTKAGSCNATAYYNITSTGTPAPEISYVFTGATTQSGTGTGSGLTFNPGTTTVQVTATNICGSVNCEFTATVEDNEEPVLTIPDNTSVTCSESSHPDNTGWATATDNCSAPGNIDITYSDAIADGNCGSNYEITRTWTATDESGNISVSQNQSIHVTDNTPPVITSTGDLTVQCPADIPEVDNTVISAVDDCGAVTVEFLYEEAYGLADKPGYCPSGIGRTFRVTDECGNYTDAVHIITVQEECGCEECVTWDAFREVDLRGDPDGSLSFTVTRADKCCGIQEENRYQNYYCASFNVILDEGAVGVEILIDGTTPQGQYWAKDCNDIEGGSIVCLPSGEYHLFTYCKAGDGSGSVSNEYTFNSIQGVVISDNIQARVDCQGQLDAEGIVSEPVWTSISPGARGDYDHYLSGTTVSDPMFTPDENAPPVIEYEVSGNIGSTVCSDEARDTTTVSVYVKDAIDIDLNINPEMVCQDDIPTLNPDISPSASYQLEWYSGYDASGALLHTGSSYTPESEGLYSLVVTDMQEGIPCSADTFNFDIVFDHTGPTVQEPPAPLEIQCNAPGADQQIQDWLALATATYTNADGNTVNAAVSNNYNGINMACGEVLTVTFSAEDQCANENTTTSTITVIDTIPPTISCPAATSNVADEDLCLIQELVLEAPTASDDCGTPAITWEKTGDTEGTGTGTVTGPFNVGVTMVTYTAADDCGNTATCTQEVTITDDQPPDVINCPEDVLATAPAPACEREDLVIGPPDYTDNCGNGNVTLSWEKTGATTGSGNGLVDETVFNVGVTTVTYILSDPAGNTAECSFTVTIDEDVPPTIIECPESTITVNMDPDTCGAYVTVPAPTADDLCSNVASIVHDSPYGADEMDASGAYPVGTTSVTWSVLDEWGNTNATCIQEITVTDNQPPEITCPPNVTAFADYGENFAGDVVFDEPTIFDNCPDPVLSHTIEPPALWASEYEESELSGTGIFPSPNTFYTGVTTITYTAADAGGNASVCSFTITIESAPIIECPDNWEVFTDEGECHATLDPGGPTLIQGAQPITWEWSITGPDGTEEASGSFTGSPSDPGPPSIGLYDFAVGVSTIHWSATNSAGNDDCTHTVTVTDNEPPVIDPPGPFEFCVENLFLAQYTGSINLNYSPDYPNADYFLLRNGDTALDLDPATITDNCCAPGTDDFTIEWQIDFDGAEPSVSGTGQPSEYGDDIKIWGDGVNYQNRHHTITYRITDCNGSESAPAVVDITITPRPKIEKQ